MDGAFFREDVIELLESEGGGVGDQGAVFRVAGTEGADCQTPALARGGRCGGGFEQRVRVPAWSDPMRVAIYRKRVHYLTAKNYQADLFDPDDGYYE